MILHALIHLLFPETGKRINVAVRLNNVSCSVTSPQCLGASTILVGTGSMLLLDSPHFPLFQIMSLLKTLQNIPDV